MTLLAPAFLWLLVGVLALVALYVVLQRRRRHYAVRFTNLDLLESVAPKRPGWRRHVPAAVVAVAMVVGIIGLARPAHDVARPEGDGDRHARHGHVRRRWRPPTSPRPACRRRSRPRRAFVDDLPAGFSVGLVAFAGTATSVLAADHRPRLGQDGDQQPAARPGHRGRRRASTPRVAAIKAAAGGRRQTWPTATAGGRQRRAGRRRRSCCCPTAARRRAPTRSTRPRPPARPTSRSRRSRTAPPTAP